MKNYTFSNPQSFLKGLRSTISVMILCCIMLFFSCKPGNKKHDSAETTTTDTVTQVVNPISKTKVTDAQIDALISSLKPHREEFIRVLEKDHPGLFQKYQDDCKKIIDIMGKSKDQNTPDNLDKNIENTLAQLDNIYKEKFKKSYSESGIEKTVSDIIKAWADSFHLNVVLGELGTLAVREDALPGDPTPRPDSTIVFTCPFDKKDAMSTTSLNGSTDRSDVDDCKVTAVSKVLFLGTADFEGGLGKEVIVPLGFKGVTGMFFASYDIHLFAVAVGAGSWSRGVVGSRIDNFNVTKAETVLRDELAVAPIVWYVRSQVLENNQRIFATWDIGASPNIPATPKLFCKSTSVGIPSLGSGANSLASFFKIDSLVVFMHQ